MNWTILLPIIAQHGIPYAFEMWKIMQKHEKPTDAAWEELLALSQKSMESYIEDARKRQR
jgi:hypothetical protein